MKVKRTERTIYYLFIILIIAFSCSKSNERPIDNLVELPYPSLAEQRKVIASKTKVPLIRVLDSLQIIRDLEFIASDMCEGRKPGSGGHDLASNYILSQMRSNGLDSFNSSLIQTFTGSLIDKTTTGKNLIGFVKGIDFPDKYIVITAHYDHLGKTVDGNVFNGADDNASGVACLLAMAKYFHLNPSSYSLVFAALDREETGLEGAYNLVHFLGNLLGEKGIVLNLNMDMIARSDSNEIFICGLRNYPYFQYVIDQAQNKTNVGLLKGHDGGASGKDWTHSSDHSAFHQKNIPFLYIGVEDHQDYHKVSDEVEKINYSRLIDNCNFISVIVQYVR